MMTGLNKGLRNELSYLLGGLSIVLCLLRRPKSGVMLGLFAVGLRYWKHRRFSLFNRVVVITGGSRGLGLALAEAFIEEGASVTLLARDREELQRAVVRMPANRVHIIPCDITKPEQLERALAEAKARFRHIDILVNNAGAIAVGPFDTMNAEDFEAQLSLHVNAILNATRQVVPMFRNQGGGRIINISSIGGQLPVPHMSTYCTSKFALSGLSETLSAELAEDNIKVITAYPGLMRTGSPIQGVFKGDCEKEYGWFAAGDVTPVLSVSARYAARKIVEGVKNGDSQVVFPFVTRLGIWTHALLPETYGFIVRCAAQLMPKSHSSVRKTGANSRTWLENQIWYKPFQPLQHQAERQFNQQEKLDAEFNLGLKPQEHHEQN